MATDEPKPTADELLRRYADERRSQAGAPLELHPATRKLLQDEVARAFGKPAAESRPTTRAMAGWWLRLAWGGAALVAVAVLLVIVTLPGRRAVEPLQIAKKTKSETRGQPERARALAENLEERQARKPVALLSDQRSQGSADKGAARDAIDRLAARGPAQAVGGVGTAGVVEAAKGPGPYQPAENSRPVAAAAAPTPALVANQREVVVVGNQAPYVAGNTLTGAGPLRFVQVDSRARYRRNFNSPALPPVLTSFEVERGPDQIRIIDADGSIYQGRISNVQAGAAVSQLAVNAPAQLGTDLRKDVAVLEAQTNRTRLQSGSVGVENYSFRAVGTNRLSKQTVVFSGEFVVAPWSNGLGSNQYGMIPRSSGVALPAAPTTAVGTGGGLAQLQTRATNLSHAAPAATLPPAANQAPVGLIEGKVVVGGTNTFELQAVPAGR